MADYNNFADLKSAFEKKAKKSLNTGVKKVIVDEMNERIKHSVYGVYTPIMYERNFSLYNLSNYKSKVQTVGDEIQLTVEHEATVNGQNLSKLIILGQTGAKAYGSGVAHYNDQWIKMRQFRYAKDGNNGEIPFYEPRDFLSATLQTLSFDRNRNKLVKELEKGMN